MSYAVRNDYQGWRAICAVDDLLDGEFFAEVAPPTAQHRWRDGKWVLDQQAGLLERRAATLAAINTAANTALSTLSAAYPEREVASWPQQVREADALAASPTAAAPLLSAIATARDIPLLLLAQRVIEKSTAYAVASGAIIGRRQALEDAITAAGDDAAALAAIDIASGWPGGAA